MAVQREQVYHAGPPKQDRGLLVLGIPRRIAFSLLLLPALAPSAFAGDPTLLIVGYEGEPPAAVGDRLDGGLVIEVHEALSFLVVRTDQPASTRAQIDDDDRLSYVETNAKSRWIEASPDDTFYAQYQYGPRAVGAPAAWDRWTGGPGLNVCIVDTGARYTHQDLMGGYLGGVDIVNGDLDPWDDNGHGTHVAGIAAARLDNGLGIAGLANVGWLAAKVLDAAGEGTISDIAEGIRWCADNGGRVINLSLGANVASTTLRNAVAYAAQRGSLLVAAAGNEGPCTNCIRYPAAFSDVVAVTCVNEAGALCGFSSTGVEAELAAPGDDILSTSWTGPDRYGFDSGTSMSAPHVSGAAALLWSRSPDLTAADVRALLRASAVDLGTPGRDARFGFGLLDVGAAFADLVATSPPVAAFTSAVVDGGIQFTDASTDADGSVVAWSWAFGDGGASAEQSPLHSFAAPGSYTVWLTVTDDAGITDDASRVVRLLGPSRAVGRLAWMGGPVAGATLTFDSTTAGTREAATDAAGAFDVQLPAGRWTLSADLAQPDFRLSRAVPFAVRPGAATAVAAQVVPTFAALDVRFRDLDLASARMEISSAAGPVGACDLTLLRGAVTGAACDAGIELVRAPAVFRVPDLGTARGRLTVAAAGGQADTAPEVALANVMLRTGRTTVAYADLQPNTLNLVVSGAARAGAQVTLTDAAGGVHAATTDRAGRAVLAWIPSGPAHIDLVGTRGETASLDTEIGARTRSARASLS